MTAPTRPDSLPDLRPALGQALAVTSAVVATVTPADLDRPTPCADFAVRGLLDHLVMVVRRVRVLIDGGAFSDVPQVLDLPDPELVPAFAEGAAALEAALPGADLGAMIVAPFGTVPLAAAFGSYAGELLTHSWDLAAALGRVGDLGPAAAELAELALPGTLGRLPREGREHLPFGEVVEVADDAPALDRLLGWVGRDPAWTAAM